MHFIEFQKRYIYTEKWRVKKKHVLIQSDFPRLVYARR